MTAQMTARTRTANGFCKFGTGRLLVALALLVAALVFTAVLPSAASAAGYMPGFGPQLYKSGYSYGNGIYFAPYEVAIHAEPDEASPLVQVVRWTPKSGYSVQTGVDGLSKMPADHVFFSFYPSLDVAMMAVTAEPGNGWVEVVWDQANHKTGWVRLGDTNDFTERHPEHFGVYQTWQDFMKLNAKANGIYWLSGVSQYQRSVRFSDDDKAKLIPITIIRDLKVRHIRGNWLLVEVLDFERNTPIGWVRWRDKDGNLLVFPNLSGDKMPIVTTAF